MRTNVIDSLAFRCLTEYKRIVDIYVKLKEIKLDYLYVEYIKELDELETAKEIRKHHRDSIEQMLENINDLIDKKIMKGIPVPPVNFSINKNL